MPRSPCKTLTLLGLASTQEQATPLPANSRGERKFIKGKTQSLWMQSKAGRAIPGTQQPVWMGSLLATPWQTQVGWDASLWPQNSSSSSTSFPTSSHSLLLLAKADSPLLSEQPPDIADPSWSCARGPDHEEQGPCHAMTVTGCMKEPLLLLCTNTNSLCPRLS